VTSCASVCRSCQLWELPGEGPAKVVRKMRGGTGRERTCLRAFQFDPGAVTTLVLRGLVAGSMAGGESVVGEALKQRSEFHLLTF
jgi:hypothetical protein